MSTLCPSCGSKVLPGDVTCPNCYVALTGDTFADPSKPGAVPNPYGSPVDIHDVDTVDGSFLLWVLFSPQGRVPRRVWWIAGIAVNIVTYICHGALLFALQIPLDESNLSPSVEMAILIPHGVRLWIQLTLSIKRSHDRGHSGWWVLWVFFPCVGGLVLLIDLGFLPGTSGPNEYGQDPTEDASRGRIPAGPDDWIGSRKLPDKVGLPTGFADPPVRHTIQCPFCDAMVEAGDDVEFCPHCNRPLL